MQKTHGEVRRIDGKRVASPEYNSWQHMKNRCLNPKCRDYAYYGARGITVCKRWLQFEHFLTDMGRRPSPLHTLERRDNMKGYSTSNCAWATRETQARNRRYATTRAWELAAALGVTTNTARHMIAEVRAKDRGNTSWFSLSPEREEVTRAFMKATNDKTV